MSIPRPSSPAAFADGREPFSPALLLWPWQLVVRRPGVAQLNCQLPEGKVPLPPSPSISRCYCSAGQGVSEQPPPALQLSL